MHVACNIHVHESIKNTCYTCSYTEAKISTKTKRRCASFCNMKSNFQSNGLRYATTLLVCCSLNAAQSQITPASIKTKVYDNDGVCNPDSIQRSQVENKIDSQSLQLTLGLHNHTRFKLHFLSHSDINCSLVDTRNILLCET